MDYTNITQFIGSVGFPIVCCAYMMITNNKTIQENTIATNKMTSLIEKLIDRLSTHE